MTTRLFLKILVLNVMAMAVQAQSGKSLPGEYYLQGVMETASGFLLKPDSSFEFYFSQGALDRTGEGHWIVLNGKVVLQSDPWPGLDFKLDSSSHSAHESILIKVLEKKTVIAICRCNAVER